MAKKKTGAKESVPAVPFDVIRQSIQVLRGEQVLLDADLARLYRVETSALNRAVKRNSKRFPPEFMFQLTREEFEDLRCQIGTFNLRNRKYLPYAFTEQGVAMLSSVLTSDRAIQVNIEIMKAFVHMRRILASNRALARRMEELEERLDEHDTEIAVIFDEIRKIIEPDPKPQGRIGFKTNK